MTLADPRSEGLHVRHRQAELMDDPALDAGRHRQALRALRRVNRISFATSRLWSEVRRVHAATGRTVRVLDVACGGGDVLLDVAARARRTAVPAVLHGCDVSPIALDEVRRLAAERGFSDVDGFALDVLHDSLPGGYDIVTSNLFLHHLDRSDAVGLLRRMADVVTCSLLIQDLLRTRLGYALAWLGLHTLTTSDVARVDGLRSVRAAFTFDEAVAMCAEAGLGDARVEQAWPQRFIVTWRRR